MKYNFVALVITSLLLSNSALGKEKVAKAELIVVSAPSVTQGRPNNNCPQFQVFGYPVIADPKVLRRAFYTCRMGYAGLYDPSERTPLWIAEHLTKSGFAGDAQREYLDFIPDPDIPRGAMPKPGDYAKSGFDKGHLAPAADFKNSQAAMTEAFQFGNAVPQAPESNRHTWKQLEDATREIALRRGEIFVVSGPIYSQSPRRKLGNSVSIPDATFKILIDAKGRTMTGFVVPNSPDVDKDFRVYQVKIREIEKLTGLNFNPNLSRLEADKLEVLTGGDWVMPKNKIRDVSVR